MNNHFCKLSVLAFINALMTQMFMGIRLYANINLTSDMITDKSLQILHQKLNLVGNIITEYDDSFAKEGARIGNTMRIRQPIQYGTGTGATMSTGTGADTEQSMTTLTVSTQRHVPMRFTSEELTMDIDKFTERHIEPAVSVLAAKIESDAFSMIDEVANTVHCGAAVTFGEVLQGRKKLVDALAPNNNRYAILDSQANVDMVDALKGLFNDGSSIGKQYKEGLMGHTAGFDFFENTLTGQHTTGAEGGGTAYAVNDATAGVKVGTNLTQGSLKVDTGTRTIKKGDVFTLASVYEVQPESKVSNGILRQFTVLTDATGASTLQIAPPIITAGEYQNVSKAPANNSKLTFLGVASTVYNQSLLFQKGFACFATADLVMPKNVHMVSRRNHDGISMRLVQDYAIVKDRIYTRLDVLYGYKVLRPQLACKVLHT